MSIRIDIDVKFGGVDIILLSTVYMKKRKGKEKKQYTNMYITLHPSTVI
jgi:hypothetical protein